MLSAARHGTFLLTLALAIALPTGSAAAATTLEDTGTTLRVTADAGPDWTYVGSEDSTVIALASSRPPDTSCVNPSAEWGGCDLSGTSGRTLDVDLGDGDNLLLLSAHLAEVSTIDVTAGSGADVIDLHGNDWTPAAAKTDVTAGGGDDLIDARNHVADPIACGSGEDTVYTDVAGQSASSPNLTDCEHVIVDSDTAAATTRVRWLEAGEWRGTGYFTNHRFLHASALAGPVASLRCRSDVSGWQACAAGQDVGPVGGFPEERNADVSNAELTTHTAVALGRTAGGAIGLPDLESEPEFVFDYTAPDPPVLPGDYELPAVADGEDIDWWPLEYDFGTASEPLCSLDGAAERSCDSSDGYWGPIGVGDHVLVARVRDAAGNLSTPITLRWHTSAPAGATPTTTTPRTTAPTAPPAAEPQTRPSQPRRGAPTLSVPRHPVKTAHRTVKLAVSCPRGGACSAATYTLEFRLRGKTVRVKARLRALAGGRRATLRFKLSKRQARALRHHRVTATVTAARTKRVRVRLRG